MLHFGGLRQCWCQAVLTHPFPSLLLCLLIWHVFAGNWDQSTRECPVIATRYVLKAGRHIYRVQVVPVERDRLLATHGEVHSLHSRKHLHYLLHSSMHSRSLSYAPRKSHKRMRPYPNGRKQVIWGDKVARFTSHEVQMCWLALFL